MNNDVETGRTGASLLEQTELLGIDRVVSPRGALPQSAEVLDPSGPVRDFEFEVAVDRLCLDATSFRSIKAETGGDPARMARRIEEIVAGRGKMHNPVTDSGGIALGAVTKVGSRFEQAPAIGDRIVTLASLTLTPLRLDAVLDVDPRSAQVAVAGTAYVCARAPWGPLPDDLETTRAVEVYDVYGAASHTRRLAAGTRVVSVLGCGHAGKLAMAAGREAMGGGVVVAVDVDPTAVARVVSSGLADIGVVADLQDPLAALAAMDAVGAPPADLTVVVVDAQRCESSAILATREGGTVLFFSMATNFSTAALSADGMGHDVTMLVGSGYTPDKGRYALDLVRRTPALRTAFASIAGA